MLLSILPVPFADAGRQRQYEAVLAALHAEADAPATVLLGNLPAFAPVEADVLVVRPSGLALVVLAPHAGQLTMGARPADAWQLGGQRLPGGEGASNPLMQYQQQLPPVLAWLDEQLLRPVAELLPCVGLALFEAPLTFGAGVETQLHHHAADYEFQLVGGAARLPARLRQHFAAKADILADFELLDWASSLLGEPTVASGQTSSPAVLLKQKLRQLWAWLGAADIPADPPYGGGPPSDQPQRDQQEQARLQQLRQELLAELHQQRREAAAREAARTQELTQLRQQLAQASLATPERPAEQRTKEALEASLRTTRAELAARTQELDARIQQLGQLIKQLQAAPAAATPAIARAGARPKQAAAPAWSFRRLRQAERWGLVVLAWAGVGAGTWGVVRWVQHAAPPPATTALRHPAPPEDTASEDQPTDPTDPGERPDSLAGAQAATPDTVATPSPPEPTAPAAATTEAIAPPAQLHVDSAVLLVKPTPLIRGADSAASPAP